jgi:4-amino-4-deoxy-L-arabinose transferase-like glycosyltransferase
MRRVVPAVIVLGTLALYSFWLTRSPIYLDDTEVLFGLHAHALATSLHDANGRFLPLYFQMKSIGDNVWFQPMLPYWTALFSFFLPVSVWAVRLPTAMVGVVDVVLTYFIGRRIFGSAAYGAATAILLALTPAHYLHARIAMDYIYPLPFVLGWMLCLVTFDDTHQRRLIFAAGLALGIGLCSYLGAVGMLPMYLVLTLVYLLHKYRRVDWSLGIVVAGFLLPAVLLALWIGRHPDVYAGTVARYGVASGGVRQLLHFYIIGDRISIYWNYFNPTYLFLTGGIDIFTSTRYVGVFLIALAPLMIAGLYDVVTRRTRPGWLVLAGALTAPVSAVLVGDGSAIYRELELLPFAALLATFGLRSMLQSTERVWRFTAIACLVLVPLQFAVFQKDYFTNYRLLSAGRFGGDIRRAVKTIVDRDRQKPLPAVYISDALAYPMDRYRFYLQEFGHERLLERSHLLEPKVSARAIPRGSLVLAAIIDGMPFLTQPVPAELRTVVSIIEPTGATSYVLLER